MSMVFVDTVGLLALWNKSDQWHSDAKKAFARIDENEHLFTTRFVLLECGNAAARTLFRDEVERIRAQFETAQTLISPTEEDWENAWKAYRRGENGNAGIVDQTSFVVMRRLGIHRAFTNDQHFRAAGFEVLF